MAVRLVNQQKALLVSDVLLLVSCVFALGLIITDTMTYKLGALSGKDIEDPDTLIRLGKVRTTYCDVLLLPPQLRRLS